MQVWLALNTDCGEAVDVIAVALNRERAKTLCVFTEVARRKTLGRQRVPHYIFPTVWRDNETSSYWDSYEVSAYDVDEGEF